MEGSNNSASILMTSEEFDRYGITREGLDSCHIEGVLNASDERYGYMTQEAKDLLEKRKSGMESAQRMVENAQEPGKVGEAGEFVTKEEGQEDKEIGSNV